MSSLKSVLYFVCLYVLSCFLFILPLLISPCPHFWSEFMASRDRLWRDYLKSLFLRGIQVSPRSVTILTFNFFKIPETTLKKVPCTASRILFVHTRRDNYQDDFASPLFLYKNIFVAFSLFVKINTIFRYIAPSKLNFTTFITVLWVTQSEKLEKLNIQNNLRTISLTSTLFTETNKASVKGWGLFQNSYNELVNEFQQEKVNTYKGTIYYRAM